MEALPKHKLTPAEYLAFERRAETRHEYFAGETFAMSGGSFYHNLIKEHLVLELGIQLKGGPCRTLSSDQRVLINATGLYTYPDVIVFCGDPLFIDEFHDTLTYPKVIIEILSPSTERYDRGTKFQHYRTIPSLQEYLLISQNQAVCEQFVRQPNGTWNLSSTIGLDQILQFASIQAKVSLADLYAGVTFSGMDTASTEIDRRPSTIN